MKFTKSSSADYHWLKRLSWSGYRLYKDCPYAYEFRYVKKKKVPYNSYNSIGGKTVQKVFELFYNDEIWRRGADTHKVLLDILKRQYRRMVSRNWVNWDAPESKLTSEELYESLIPVIGSTLKLIKDEKLIGRYAKSEVKLQAWLDKTLIHGITDFVIRRDNSHILLDGKLTVHRDKYLKRDQLVWYAMLFYLQHQVMIEKIGWLYYTYGEIKWVEITEQDLTRLHGEVAAAIKSIKQRKFEPTPSADACRFCDFKPFCKAQQDLEMTQNLASAKRRQAKLEKSNSPLLDEDSDEIGF